MYLTNSIPRVVAIRRSKIPRIISLLEEFISLLSTLSPLFVALHVDTARWERAHNVDAVRGSWLLPGACNVAAESAKLATLYCAFATPLRRAV